MNDFRSERNGTVNSDQADLIPKEPPPHDHGHDHGHDHHHSDHEDKNEVHDDETHDDPEDAPLITPKKMSHSAKMRRRGLIALVLALILTVIFMVGEVIGGYIAGSLAIMTDAAHLLTDVAALLLSLVAMHLAKRGPTSRMSFGYYRAEIMGALISVLMIWALIGILLYEAGERLKSDAKLAGETVDGMIMTIVGGGGLAVNVVNAFILGWGNATHGHSHGGHSHGAKPGDDSTRTKKHVFANVNVQSAFIHVLGDCIQSLGVVVAGIVIWIGNKEVYGSPNVAKSYFNLADPITTVVFGIVTLLTTLRLLKQIVSVLMERVPSHIDLKEVQRDMEAIAGVESVHDLHIWALTFGKVYLAVHIRSDEEGVLQEAQRVCKRYGITHSTIQIESESAIRAECRADTT